jgi:hypothetical protein
MSFWLAFISLPVAVYHASERTATSWIAGIPVYNYDQAPVSIQSSSSQPESSEWIVVLRPGKWSDQRKVCTTAGPACIQQGDSQAGGLTYVVLEATETKLEQIIAEAVDEGNSSAFAFIEPSMPTAGASSIEKMHEFNMPSADYRQPATCGGGYRMEGFRRSTETYGYQFCEKYELGSLVNVSAGQAGAEECKALCDADPTCMVYTKYGVACISGQAANPGKCNSTWETRCYLIADCGNFFARGHTGMYGAITCSKAPDGVELASWVNRTDNGVELPDWVEQLDAK